MANGRLFSTSGDDSWPVRYQIYIAEGRAAVTGTIEFPAGTRLQTHNPQQPVYLRLNDGRWARLFLPVEPPDQTLYTVGDGSELTEAPKWAK